MWAIAFNETRSVLGKVFAKFTNRVSKSTQHFMVNSVSIRHALLNINFPHSWVKMFDASKIFFLEKKIKGHMADASTEIINVLDVFPNPWLVTQLFPRNSDTVQTSVIQKQVDLLPCVASPWGYTDSTDQKNLGHSKLKISYFS